MSFLPSSIRVLDKATSSRALGLLIKLVLVAGVIVLTAYLAVTQNWRIAVAVIAFPIMFVMMHRYPFLTMTVWLVLDPFLLTSSTAAERTVYWIIHRALPPATLLVILMSSLLGLSKRKLPKLGWAELGMLGYVVASLLSIYYLSSDPQGTAYHFWDRVISPMCLYLVVRLSRPDEADLRKLLPAVLFLGVSQAAIGILSWFDPGLLPSAWLDLAGLRTTGSLVNTTVYSTTLVFSGLLVLHFALNHKQILIRSMFIAAFALMFFCLLISFSRASWLGTGVVLLGLVFIYPKFMARIGIIALIAGIFFGGFLLTRLDWAVEWANQRLYSQEAQVSAFSRVPVALAALRMFEAKPLLGWGYGNFDVYSSQFQGYVLGIADDARLHASHNFFLTLLAEQGLLGAVLFLLPVIYWLSRTFRILANMPPGGFWSRKFPLVLWLIMLNEVVLINFSNLRVVFGWGLWWVTLGFIAVINYHEKQRLEMSADAA
jgi:O-antigen ligase